MCKSGNTFVVLSDVYEKLSQYKTKTKDFFSGIFIFYNYCEILLKRNGLRIVANTYENMRFKLKWKPYKNNSKYVKLRYVSKYTLITLWFDEKKKCEFEVLKIHICTQIRCVKDRISVFNAALSLRLVHKVKGKTLSC